MRSAVRLLAAAAALGCATYSAQAVLVTNLTTNTVLWDSGSFESETVGQTLGSPWTNNGQGASTIEDFGSTGVNAYHGDQFLRLVGDGGDPTIGSSPNFSAAATDVIQIAFALWAVQDAGNGDEASVRLRTYGVDLLFHDDGSIQDHNGTSRSTLSSALTPGGWNEVVIQFEHGSTQAVNPQISINGGAFEALDVRNTSQYALINFRSDWGDDTFDNAIAYIDSIPEPASLALIGLGGLLMLRRKRD